MLTTLHQQRFFLLETRVGIWQHFFIKSESSTNVLIGVAGSFNARVYNITACLNNAGLSVCVGVLCWELWEGLMVRAESDVSD